jgi:choline dehydrogenase
VCTNARATKIILENKRATAVEYLHRGEQCRASAQGEIILCAGTFNSPQILMLSGIGPAAHLRECGLPVVADLAGVGGNLTDHALGSVQMACARPVSLYRHLRLTARAAALLFWLARRDGVLASNHFECGAFLRCSADAPFPDLQLSFFPIAVEEGSKNFVRRHGFQVQITPQRPRSRGEVRLMSADPGAPPKIQFNYLQAAEDWNDLRIGFRRAREILRRPAMRKFCEYEISPGAGVQTDAELNEHIRRRLQSSYHPCGTCKMGRDAAAVVDPECRVYGVERLRVADASIMPSIPSANLNCPTMMIGEKASDLIAKRVPPPPIKAAPGS